MSRVVVLRALGLGDLLTAVPALRALRRHFPGSQLTLCAPAALAPLVELTGAVDELVDTAPLAPLDPRLDRPDVAVNLHGRGPESTRLLVGLHPGRLLAFRHREVPPTLGGPVWTADEHEVIRWCRMLAHHDIAADPGDLALDPPTQPPPAHLVGATIIHPGAAGPARRWPPDRWAEVARAEIGRGRTVVLTGSAAEQPLARSVAEQAGLGSDAVLAGTTDLAALAALVAGAGRVLCGDTGLAHLASAYGTPSVVLFGPTPPRWWGPPPGPHRVIWKGSTGDPHGRELDPGLDRVRVDEVLAAIDELPEREAA